MIIKDAYIITTAVNQKGYPEGQTPEIAFIGRSNVGKSSLINALCARKALARTSATPGKTRAINFFAVVLKKEPQILNGEDTAQAVNKKQKTTKPSVVFTDLPGYGYAKASKTEIGKWGKMTEGYLKDREQLKLIVFLLDLRRVPTQDDVMMYEWLTYYDKNIVIAATKADKLNTREQISGVNTIKKTLGLPQTVLVVPFSAPKKTGYDALWAAIMSQI